jgi:hypothetical protein
MVSSRLNLLAPQKRFEDASVVDILKYGNIHPRMMASRAHSYLSFTWAS